MQPQGGTGAQRTINSKEHRRIASMLQLWNCRRCAWCRSMESTPREALKQPTQPYSCPPRHQSHCHSMSQRKVYLSPIRRCCSGGRSSRCEQQTQSYSHPPGHQSHCHIMLSMSQRKGCLGTIRRCRTGRGSSSGGGRSSWREAADTVVQPPS